MLINILTIPSSIKTFYYCSYKNYNIYNIVIFLNYFYLNHMSDAFEFISKQ